LIRDADSWLRQVPDFPTLYDEVYEKKPAFLVFAMGCVDRYRDKLGSICH
jgi:GH35 family endo-1,4-beta-xylanase